VQTDLNGLSREFRDSSTEIYVSSCLRSPSSTWCSRAQFESFIDPFIIMFTRAAGDDRGAPRALAIRRHAQHLQQDRAGDARGPHHQARHPDVDSPTRSRPGQDGDRGGRGSPVLRLRPILMTTGAMVLGALPLALATGARAESRQQIGWVIVGGCWWGTMLTLFVVPTAYTLLARRHRTFEERLEQDRAAHRLARRGGLGLRKRFGHSRPASRPPPVPNYPAAPASPGAGTCGRSRGPSARMHGLGVGGILLP